MLTRTLLHNPPPPPPTARRGSPVSVLPVLSLGLPVSFVVLSYVFFSCYLARVLQVPLDIFSDLPEGGVAEGPAWPDSI